MHSFDFRATERRAEVGVLNQLSFSGMELAPADLQHLLVVYAGNPSHGCEAIYVGAPIADQVTSHTSWAWVEPIWQFDPNQTNAESHSAGTFVDFRDLEVPEIEVDLRDDASETGT